MEAEYTLDRGSGTRAEKNADKNGAKVKIDDKRLRRDLAEGQRKS